MILLGLSDHDSATATETATLTTSAAGAAALPEKTVSKSLTLPLRLIGSYSRSQAQKWLNVRLEVYRLNATINALLEDTTAPACIVHLDSSHCTDLQSLFGVLSQYYPSLFTLLRHLSLPSIKRMVQVRTYNGAYFEADEALFAEWLEANRVSEKTRAETELWVVVLADVTPMRAAMEMKAGRALPIRSRLAF